MSFLTPIMSFLSLGNQRTISNITGYITITENATDALEITQQPVQQGAMITDHAFLKPTAFTAQIQFSPTGYVDAAVNAAMSAVTGNKAATNTNLQTIYQQLLTLQASRQPFTVTTPKRVYQNMLLQSLSQTTDRKTENVLAITASFIQIIIVSVNTTSVPRRQQKKPARTGATQNAGKKSALLTTAKSITHGITGFTAGLAR